MFVAFTIFFILFVADIYVMVLYKKVKKKIVKKFKINKS